MSASLRPGQLRIPYRPRHAEHDRATLRMSFGSILRFVLKENTQPFRRQNEIGLKANRMNRVKGNTTRRDTRDRAAISRDLPLVISNHTQLEQPAEIFLQGNNLPEAPLIGEGFTRRHLGAVLLPVEFPIRGQVQTGSLVLRQVQRGSTQEMVTPVSGTDVIAGSRENFPRGCHEGIAKVSVGSLQTPT